jgi:hypothetical protein
MSKVHASGPDRRVAAVAGITQEIRRFSFGVSQVPCASRANIRQPTRHKKGFPPPLHYLMNCGSSVVSESFVFYS